MWMHHVGLEVWTFEPINYRWFVNASKLMYIEGFASLAGVPDNKTDGQELRQTLIWMTIPGAEIDYNDGKTGQIKWIQRGQYGKKDAKGADISQTNGQIDNHPLVVNLKSIANVPVHLPIVRDFRPMGGIPIPNKLLNITFTNQCTVLTENKLGWVDSKDPFNGMDAELHLNIWCE